MEKYRKVGRFCAFNSNEFLFIFVCFITKKKYYEENVGKKAILSLGTL